MVRRITFVAVGLLLVSVFAGAWAAPQAVDLAFKGTPGEAMKYASTLDFTVSFEVQSMGPGMPTIAITPRLAGAFTTIERVREVSPDGDLTLGLQVESFDVTLDAADLHLRLAICGPNGGPPTLIKLPELPIEMVISKRGKALAINGLDELGIPPIPGPEGESIDLTQMINRVISEFSPPLFPDRAVKVGEKWEWSMVVDPMKMMQDMGMPLPPEAEAEMPDLKIPITCTSTLVGFETVGGVQCAKIEAVAPWRLEMPVGPPGQASGFTLREEGKTLVTTWMDYARGRKVKETTRIEMTMTAGDQKTTPVRMTMLGTVASELKQ